MQKFEYFTPTKVVFGKDTVTETGRLLKEFGAAKVLVHFGRGSVQRSGLLERVHASIEAAGIAYTDLGGVVPNPRLSKVYEGIDLCRRENVDFLLAVGGGSVIDSAKAIGYGLANNGDVWDFYLGRRSPKACIPVSAVLTVAGAGSEMSDSSVITDEARGLKRSFGTDYCRPKFAVMDPQITVTVPADQTASGCVDILAHVMERYFTKDKDTELRDQLSEALMRTVIHYARVLKDHPEDYNARAQIMWAGSLAHNGLMGARAIGDWACHQLEHEISGMFDVAHGAGIAAIWTSWAHYVYQADASRFAQFAVNVFNVVNNFDKPEITALEGIAAMGDFFRSLDMPTCLKELGVEPTLAQLNQLAFSCSFEEQRTLGSFKVLERSDMLQIYTNAV